MKKAVKTIESIFAIGVLASSINVNAQNGLERVNTHELYFILEPGTMGPGVRYQKRIPSNFRFGAYGEVSKGFGDYYLKNHFKSGVGLVYYLKPEILKTRIFGGAGLSHHIYRGETNPYNREEEERLNDPFALDLCFGGRTGRFNFVVEYLPTKGFGILGAGINFGGLARSKDICATNKFFKNNKPKGKQYSKYNR